MSAPNPSTPATTPALEAGAQSKVHEKMATPTYAQAADATVCPSPLPRKAALEKLVAQAQAAGFNKAAPEWAALKKFATKTELTKIVARTESEKSAARKQAKMARAQADHASWENKLGEYGAAPQLASFMQPGKLSRAEKREKNLAKKRATAPVVSPLAIAPQRRVAQLEADEEAEATPCAAPREEKTKFLSAASFALNPSRKRLPPGEERDALAAAKRAFKAAEAEKRRAAAADRIAKIDVAKCSIPPRFAAPSGASMEGSPAPAAPIADEQPAQPQPTLPRYRLRGCGRSDADDGASDYTPSEVARLRQLLEHDDADSSPATTDDDELIFPIDESTDDDSSSEDELDGLADQPIVEIHLSQRPPLNLAALPLQISVARFERTRNPLDRPRHTRPMARGPIPSFGVGERVVLDADDDSWSDWDPEHPSVHDLYRYVLACAEDRDMFVVCYAWAHTPHRLFADAHNAEMLQLHGRPQADSPSLDIDDVFPPGQDYPSMVPHPSHGLSSWDDSPALGALARAHNRTMHALNGNIRAVDILSMQWTPSATNTVWTPPVKTTGAFAAFAIEFDCNNSATSNLFQCYPTPNAPGSGLYTPEADPEIDSFKLSPSCTMHIVRPQLNTEYYFAIRAGMNTQLPSSVCRFTVRSYSMVDSPAEFKRLAASGISWNSGPGLGAEDGFSSSVLLTSRVSAELSDAELLASAFPTYDFSNVSMIDQDTLTIKRANEPPRCGKGNLSSHETDAEPPAEPIPREAHTGEDDDWSEPPPEETTPHTARTYSGVVIGNPVDEDADVVSQEWAEIVGKAVSSLYKESTSYTVAVANRFDGLTRCVWLNDEILEESDVAMAKIDRALKTVENLAATITKEKGAAKNKSRKNKFAGDPFGEPEDRPATRAHKPTDSRAEFLADAKLLIDEADISGLIATCHENPDASLRAYAARRLAKIRREKVAFFRTTSKRGKYEPVDEDDTTTRPRYITRAMESRLIASDLLERFLLAHSWAGGYDEAVAKELNRLMHALNGNRAFARAQRPAPQQANAATSRRLFSAAATRFGHAAFLAAVRNHAMHAGNGNLAYQPRGVVSRATNALLNRAGQGGERESLASAIAIPVAELVDELANDVPFLGSANKILGEIQIPDYLKSKVSKAASSMVGSLYGEPSSDGPFSDIWGEISADPRPPVYHNAALAALGRAADTPMLGELVGPLGKAVDLFSDIRAAHGAGLRQTPRHKIDLPASWYNSSKVLSSEADAHNAEMHSDNGNVIGSLVGFRDITVSDPDQASGIHPFLVQPSQQMIQTAVDAHPRPGNPDYSRLITAFQYLMNSKSTANAVAETRYVLDAFCGLATINRVKTTHAIGAASAERHVCRDDVPAYLSENARGVAFAKFSCSEDVAVIIRNMVARGIYGGPVQNRSFYNRITDFLLSYYISSFVINADEMAADVGGTFHKAWEILGIALSMGPNGARANLLQSAGIRLTQGGRVPDLGGTCFRRHTHWPDSILDTGDGYATANSGAWVPSSLTQVGEVNAACFPLVNAAGGVDRFQAARSIAGAYRDSNIGKLFIENSDTPILVWLKTAMICPSFLGYDSENARTYHSTTDDGQGSNNAHSGYFCSAGSISDDGYARILYTCEVPLRYYDIGAGFLAPDVVELPANFNVQSLLADGFARFTYEQISSALATLLSRMGISADLFESFSFALTAHVMFQAKPQTDREFYDDAGGRHMTAINVLPTDATRRANQFRLPLFNNDTLTRGAPLTVSHLYVAGRTFSAQPTGAGTAATPRLVRPSLRGSWFQLMTVPLFVNPSKNNKLWIAPAPDDLLRRLYATASMVHIDFAKVYARIGASELDKHAFSANGYITELVANANITTGQAPLIAAYVIAGNIDAAAYDADDVGVTYCGVPIPYATMLNRSVTGAYAPAVSDDKTMIVEPMSASTHTYVVPAVGQFLAPLPKSSFPDGNMAVDADRKYEATTIAAIRRITPTGVSRYLGVAFPNAPGSRVAPVEAALTVFSAPIIDEGPAGHVTQAFRENCSYMHALIPAFDAAPETAAVAIGAVAAAAATVQYLDPLGIPENDGNNARWLGTISRHGFYFAARNSAVASGYGSEVRKRKYLSDVAAKSASTTNQARRTLFSGSSSSSSATPTEGMDGGTMRAPADLTEAETAKAAKHKILMDCQRLRAFDLSTLRITFREKWVKCFAQAIHTNRFYTDAESKAYVEKLEGYFMSPDYSEKQKVRREAKSRLYAAVMKIDADTRFNDAVSDKPAYANLSRMSEEAAFDFAHQHGFPEHVQAWLAKVHRPYRIGLMIAYALSPGARFVVDLVYSLAKHKFPTTEGVTLVFKAIDSIANGLGAQALGYQGPDCDIMNMSVLFGYAPRQEDFVDNLVDTVNRFFTPVERDPAFLRAFDAVLDDIVPKVAAQTPIQYGVTVDSLSDNPLTWLTSGATAEYHVLDADGEKQRIRKNGIPLVLTREQVKRLFFVRVLMATMAPKINEKSKFRRIMPTTTSSHATFSAFQQRTGFMKNFLRAGTSGTAAQRLQSAFVRMNLLKNGAWGFSIDYPKFDEQQSAHFSEKLWQTITSAYAKIDPTSAEYARRAGEVFTTKYVRIPGATPEERSQMKIDWLSPEAARQAAAAAGTPIKDIPTARVHHGMLSGQSSTTMENTMIGIGLWGAVLLMLKQVGGNNFTLGVSNNYQAGDDTDVYAVDPAMAHAVYTLLAKNMEMRDTDYVCRKNYSVFLKRQYHAEGFHGYINRSFVPWYQRDPLSPLSSNASSDIAELDALLTLCLRRGSDPPATHDLYYKKVRAILKSYSIPGDTRAKNVHPSLGGLGVLPLAPLAVLNEDRVNNPRPRTENTSDYVDQIAAAWQKSKDPRIPIEAYRELVLSRANAAVLRSTDAADRLKSRAEWEGFDPRVVPLRVANFFPLEKALSAALDALEKQDPKQPLPEPPRTPSVDSEIVTLARAAFGGDKGAWAWLKEASLLPGGATRFPHYSLALDLLTGVPPLGPGTGVNSMISDYLTSWYRAIFWAHPSWFKRMSYDAALYNINASVRHLLAGPRVSALLTRYAE